MTHVRLCYARGNRPVVVFTAPPNMPPGTAQSIIHAAAGTVAGLVLRSAALVHIPSWNFLRMSKLVISLVVLAVLVAGVGGYWWMQRYRGITWAKVNNMIAAKFPNVPQMPVAQLRVWLAAGKRTQPVLLDVRGRLEYEVSHLHHARWISTDESVGKAMAGIPHDQPIVAYCSVGYRSSAYCVRLMKDGFNNVHDLRGSIFAWANAGLPVYRAGKIVHHVHPYDRQWGRLLKRSLWEFAPPQVPTKMGGRP